MKNISIVIAIAAVIWLGIKLDVETYIIPPTALLPDGGQYYGELDNNLFSGEGKILWADGSEYHGHFKEGLFSGFGRITHSEGTIYEGEFVKGWLTGQGKWTTSMGEYYEGQFINYIPNGLGYWDYGQNSSYKGELMNGFYHGEGHVKYANGNSYEGQFKEGGFHGRGSYSYENGDSYLGEFKDGLYHGEGHIKYAYGDSYEGQFKEGMFHGKGSYAYEDGDRHTGDFIEDQFTGNGDYYDVDGNHYSGEFKDWFYHGKGKYIGIDGEEYEGEFVDGSLSGKGSYTNTKGETYQGKFDDWRYQGTGDLLKENGDRYQGEFSYGMYHGKGELTYAIPKEGKTSLVGKWEYDTYIGDGLSPDPNKANVETVLYNQNALLQQTLDNIVSSEQDKINLYFLGVAGDGQQDVFYKEIMTVQEIFNQKLATSDRSALLINNPKTVASIPLATTTAFKRVLTGMSDKMDVDNDILFIYLTSHGSKKHVFSLQQKGLSLPDLPAKEMGDIINELPVKWKVIVISACYSGGFIPELENDHSLIITATAADRTSFGCSDDADMTYFGRAFFQDAIPNASSFVDAFDTAKVLVTEREQQEHKKEKHSDPQISKPTAIIEHLQQWRAQF